MDSYHIPPPAGTLVSLSDVPLGSLYPFFMQWQVPVATAAIYTALAFFFNTKMPKPTAAKRSSKQRFSAMNCVVFVHNAILAVYSGWAFYTVFPQFVRGVAQKGLRDGLCDVDGYMWNSVLFAQNYLFYLSKYYELVDTLVLFLKGRTASLLQIYHHAGIIIVMYYSNYLASSVTVFMVWENAGVHTIMYTYYALTAIKINVPGKKYLTSLQIFQFLFGQSAVFLYFVLPNCQTADQRKWMWIVTAYLLPLIYLFTQFFAKTYKKDQPRIKKD
ncbi:hypothetical protein EV183_002285 [Coemansia sp. RSA 2336]|nr:hypothetical protein EV183_002285 [Coemansia sp. RSA 2336]